MVQGKKIHPTVVDFIEKRLDEDPSRTGEQLVALVEQTAGRKGLISERKAFEIKKGHKSPNKVERAEWHPWIANKNSPQEINYLLQLDASNMRDTGRHLFQDQVPWARRLRVSLEGLPMYDQLWIVREYARRGPSAVRRNRLPDYSDLDGLLAYKPWKRGNAVPYECALIAGLVPRPHVLPTPEMDERLEALRRMLSVPEDEDIKSGFYELPSYWESVRYQEQPVTPPDSDYSVPASLAKGWSKVEWPVNARAANLVTKFWETGAIKSIETASGWEKPAHKEGETDGR